MPAETSDPANGMVTSDGIGMSADSNVIKIKTPKYPNEEMKWMIHEPNSSTISPLYGKTMKDSSIVYHIVTDFLYTNCMGTLYVVATPIGNLEDISLRALRVLYAVETILCEDTRQTGLLLDLLSKRFPNIIAQEAVRPKLQRYDDHNESAVVPEIIERLENGESMALVSDAGTPLLSDPGFMLVSEARKRSLTVISVPGASAALTALTSSGLPADKFMFLGFAPEKQAHRIKLFSSLLSVHHLIRATYILYCSPHKVLAALEDMKETLGNVHIVVARELTKVHEEYWKGSVTDALSHFQDPKGEFVLLIDMRE